MTNLYIYIYISVLRSLYQLYYISDAYWKARLIHCYSEWLNNWALLNWDKHKKLEQDEQKEMDQVIWLFKGLLSDTDCFRSM